MESPFVSTWRSITRFGRHNAYPASSGFNKKNNKDNTIGNKFVTTNFIDTVITQPSLNPLNLLPSYSDGNFSNIVFDRTIDIRIIIKITIFTATCRSYYGTRS